MKFVMVTMLTVGKSKMNGTQMMMLSTIMDLLEIGFRLNLRSAWKTRIRRSRMRSVMEITLMAERLRTSGIPMMMLLMTMVSLGTGSKPAPTFIYTTTTMDALPTGGLSRPSMTSASILTN